MAFAGAQLEDGAVARTFDLAFEDLTFGERGLGVAAPIADCVDVVADTEQCDAMPESLGNDAAPFRKLGELERW